MQSHGWNRFAVDEGRGEDLASALVKISTTNKIVYSIYIS